MLVLSTWQYFFLTGPRSTVYNLWLETPLGRGVQWHFHSQGVAKERRKTRVFTSRFLTAAKFTVVKQERNGFMAAEPPQHEEP